MSLTYATLQTAIKAWLNKPEAEQFIPTFIELAEAEFNAELRVRQMIARAEATIDSEYEAVPSGFLGVRTYYLSGTPKTDLEYVTPDVFNTYRWERDTSGRPTIYTIEGDEFRFGPTPGESYTGYLSYWQEIPALSDGNPTNWLLTDRPDAYLYGALKHGANFLGGHPSQAVWESAYARALASIEKSDRTESYGAKLQTRSGNVV